MDTLTDDEKLLDKIQRNWPKMTADVLLTIECQLNKLGPEKKRQRTVFTPIMLVSIVITLSSLYIPQLRALVNAIVVLAWGAIVFLPIMCCFGILGYRQELAEGEYDELLSRANIEFMAEGTSLDRKSIALEVAFVVTLAMAGHIITSFFFFVLSAFLVIITIWVRWMIYGAFLGITRGINKAMRDIQGSHV